MQYFTVTWTTRENGAANAPITGQYEQDIEARDMAHALIRWRALWKDKDAFDMADVANLQAAAAGVAARAS